MEQTIEEFNGTKNITLGGGSSDIEAGIEFIYHMREHLLDIGIEAKQRHRQQVVLQNRRKPLCSCTEYPLAYVLTSNFF